MELTETLHPYVFAASNPQMWVDPTGESIVQIIATTVIIGILASTAIPALTSYINNARAQHLIADFSAGLGDALLLGRGQDLRDIAGLQNVNRCTTAYKSGSYASVLAGFGRIAYSLVAKGYSLFAASGAAASLGREQLKNIFRLGLFKGARSPNLAEDITDAALRASAGRTNPFVNAYGIGVFAAGLVAANECEEGD